ncbi:hypothetical protein [Mucilaginibacter paludis]|uniref:Uncharacterized protein n=1 Tax=Mucilaginibacter paludis DSM 18603 TaxID=714943 RepID=H1YF13_9SPHI|nr:hypothetical protein [Mucilaginibacter paludis]EHQ25266.1 hypothetical protein Mucpa_1097 [Mucilaginibacter paludis DSM 18603]
MNMSDKDFDQLFQSKLANMEMEPSASVWNNITDELDGKKKNKSAGLPFMQIAAGIIVLMGVSLFFLRPNTEKIPLHGYAAITTSKTADVRAEDATEGAIYDTANTNTLVIAAVSRPAKHVVKKQAITKIVSEPVNTNVDSVQSPIIVATMASNVNTPQATDVSRRSTAGSDVNPPAQSRYATPLNQVNTLAAAKNATAKNAQPVKRRKIHSLGDILNVVIAKVDKREDKIIEFTNDSDDETFNITGVNLGLFKAKKEK